MLEALNVICDNILNNNDATMLEIVSFVNLIVHLKNYKIKTKLNGQFHIVKYI